MHHGTAFLLAFGCAALAFAQTTERISVNSSGIEATYPGFGDFVEASISADGRFVAFASMATNLIDGDTNTSGDIFLRDRVAGTTLRISVTPRGGQADWSSVKPRISADGRWIVFVSSAFNMGGLGVYEYDRSTGRTAGAGPGGAPVPYAQVEGLSADGRYVLLAADSERLPGSPSSTTHAFVLDRETGVITPLVVAMDGRPTARGELPRSISADGRFVTFDSRAPDLIPGPTGATYSDVFVVDRDSDADGIFDEGFGPIEVARISSTAAWGDDDSDAGALSAEGQFVAFQSTARNLVPNDTVRNRTPEILLRDRLTGSLERMDVSSAGVPGGGRAYLPHVRLDGRLVFFSSSEAELVPGDTNESSPSGGSDGFVRDRLAPSTQRVTVTSTGAEADGASLIVDATPDGRIVVFWSAATNLVPGDENAHHDLFVRDIGSWTALEVAPSVGSRLGGDVVQVRGARATTVTDTQVTIGGAPADVLSVDGGRIAVRTPAGNDSAMVVVTTSVATSARADAFRFVEPELAARFGTVNTGRGEREDVLLVNATAGAPATRAAGVGSQQPLRLVMVSPSSRVSSAFVVYAWPRFAGATTRVTLPGGIGSLVCPAPFTGGAPQPIAVWNNLGFRRTLGTPTAPSQRAPSTLVNLPNGTGRRARVTLQGLIQDDASPTNVGLSITNAILLRVD